MIGHVAYSVTWNKRCRAVEVTTKNSYALPCAKSKTKNRCGLQVGKALDPPWLPLGPRCSAPALLPPQSHSQLFKTAVIQSTDKMAASPPRSPPSRLPFRFPRPPPRHRKRGHRPPSPLRRAPRLPYRRAAGRHCAFWRALVLLAQLCCWFPALFSFLSPCQIYPPGRVAFGNSGGLPFSACVLGHPGWCY